MKDIWGFLAINLQRPIRQNLPKVKFLEEEDIMDHFILINMKTYEEGTNF